MVNFPNFVHKNERKKKHAPSTWYKINRIATQTHIPKSHTKTSFNQFLPSLPEYKILHFFPSYLFYTLYLFLNIVEPYNKSKLNIPSFVPYTKYYILLFFFWFDNFFLIFFFSLLALFLLSWYSQFFNHLYTFWLTRLIRFNSSHQIKVIL